MDTIGSCGLETRVVLKFAVYCLTRTNGFVNMNASGLGSVG